MLWQKIIILHWNELFNTTATLEIEIEIATATMVNSPVINSQTDV